jgi:shikimate dehydrogenase
LESSQMLYDLVYNPPLTPFLEEGLMRGLAVKNGLEMLQRQAMLSWEIWQRRA